MWSSGSVSKSDHKAPLGTQHVISICVFGRGRHFDSSTQTHTSVTAVICNLDN